MRRAKQMETHIIMRRAIGRLRRAGYLREAPTRVRGTAVTSNGFKKFTLVRNTGPIAPVWSDARKCLHDFNLEADMTCPRQ